VWGGGVARARHGIRAAGTYRLRQGGRCRASRRGEARGRKGHNAAYWLQSGIRSCRLTPCQGLTTHMPAAALPCAPLGNTALSIVSVVALEKQAHVVEG